MGLIGIRCVKPNSWACDFFISVCCFAILTAICIMMLMMMAFVIVTTVTIVVTAFMIIVIIVITIVIMVGILNVLVTSATEIMFLFVCLFVVNKIKSYE